MLDLAFVRANLPLVEQKLRDRNMNPATVLGDFAAIDARRRDAIMAPCAVARSSFYSSTKPPPFPKARTG